MAFSVPLICPSIGQFHFFKMAEMLGERRLLRMVPVVNLRCSKDHSRVIGAETNHKGANFYLCALIFILKAAGGLSLYLYYRLEYICIFD